MTDESVFGMDDAVPDDQAAKSDPPPGGGDKPEDPPKDAAGAGKDGDGDDGKEADGNEDPSPAPQPPAPVTSGPGVNSMILDAVKQSNSAVLGAAGSNGSAIAYQKVAQAAAFAVQDSTDYLRNIMAMSSAATGVALKKMVENPATAAQYTPVLTAAQGAVTAAQENFTAVGTAAGTVVSGFPSGS